MADVYSLLTNDHVKSIICNYATNSVEYNEYLLLKYYLEFFKVKILREYGKKYITERDDSLDLLKKFIYNFRWYISESYLEDIRTLKGKENITKFWYELYHYWFSNIFNYTRKCLNKVKYFDIKFVLTSIGSFEKLECCLFYEEVYRLAISHKYIESILFDTVVDCNLGYKYLNVKLRTAYLCLSLRDIYNSIVTLYKEYPGNYEIKDGFIVG